MKDTELDRIATILEKLAYEDDVRRIIRKIKTIIIMLLIEDQVITAYSIFLGATCILSFIAYLVHEFFKNNKDGND